MGVGMAEIRDGEQSLRRLSTVAALLIFAAVIGIPYACDRVYRKWSKENHLLAEIRASLERARSGYQDGRANVTEVAQVISMVLVEVDRARSQGRR